jgi:glycosyltransferase involved in cell wall biosynthesis
MPCFNAEKFIRQSIESVINQTYSNWELIIINDCSNDTSLKIINSYNDKRIKIINNLTNEGVSFSRNQGIKIAKGNFISFLDSDDIWHDDMLMTQLIYLNSGFDVCCSNYFIIDEKGKKIKEIKDIEIIDSKSILKSNLIPNSSASYNAFTLGKFYQKNIGHEDYLMWLLMFKKSSKLKVIRVQKPLMLYRSHSKNLSHSKLKSAMWTLNIYYNELDFSLIHSLYYFSFYFTKGIKKHITL